MIQASTRTSLILLVSINFNLIGCLISTYWQQLFDIEILCAESSSGNAAADHNLDLSLGNSIPKQNSLALGNDITGNAATGQHSAAAAAPMPFEPDWQNRGFRPKVIVHLSFYLN